MLRRSSSVNSRIIFVHFFIKHSKVIIVKFYTNLLLQSWTPKLHYATERCILEFLKICLSPIFLPFSNQEHRCQGLETTSNTCNHIKIEMFLNPSEQKLKMKIFINFTEVNINYEDSRTTFFSLNMSRPVHQTIRRKACKNKVKVWTKASS